MNRHVTKTNYYDQHNFITFCVLCGEEASGNDHEKERVTLKEPCITAMRYDDVNSVEHAIEQLKSKFRGNVDSTHTCNIYNDGNVHDDVLYCTQCGSKYELLYYPCEPTFSFDDYEEGRGIKKVAQTFDTLNTLDTLDTVCLPNSNVSDTSATAVVNNVRSIAREKTNSYPGCRSGGNRHGWPALH